MSIPNKASESLPAAGEKILSLRIDPAVWARLRKRLPSFSQQVDSRASFSEVPLVSAYRVMAVDYDAISAEDRARMEKLAGAARRTEFIVISSGKCLEELRRLVSLKVVTHVLAKRYGDVDEVDLGITTRKIASKDIFGLEVYLEWGADSSCLRLESREDQQRAMEHIQTYARTRNIHPRLAALFTDAGDELVTNALRHAEGKGAIEVRCGFNGRSLGLSVLDPGGRLSKEQALSNVASAWPGVNNAASTLAQSLGLAKVLASVSQLDINLVEGRRTEFIALLDVWGSYRDFAQSVKSFNIYERSA